MTQTPETHRRMQQGVSLVELLIGVVVGLLLLGGLIQIYLSNKQSYNAQEQLSRMQESGRLAMDLIASDLRRAGYWGGNVDVSTITGLPGRVDPAGPAPTCVAADAAWGRMIRWRVSGLAGDNTGYSECTGPEYIDDTDILTVRYAGNVIPNVPSASGPPDPPNNLEANRLYLRSTLFAGRLLRGGTLPGVPDGVDAVENQLPPDDDAPEHLYGLFRPVVSNAYFVADSGRACNGEPIPSLFRITLGPNGTPSAPEEIATGVEQFQVRYLLGDEYGDAADVAGNWVQVSAVRVYLLVRSECPELGLSSALTYNLGGLPWPASPDQFRRQLYSTTVMLRNTLVR